MQGVHENKDGGMEEKFRPTQFTLAIQCDSSFTPDYLTSQPYICPQLHSPQTHPLSIEDHTDCFPEVDVNAGLHPACILDVFVHCYVNVFTCEPYRVQA